MEWPHTSPSLHVIWQNTYQATELTVVCQHLICHYNGLTHRITNFWKILEPPWNSKCQQCVTKHIPYRKPRNIRYQSTKFNHLGNLAPRTGVFPTLQHWKTLFWALSRGQGLHTVIATITLLFHKYFNVCHKKHEHVTVCLECDSACPDALYV